VRRIAGVEETDVPLTGDPVCWREPLPSPVSADANFRTGAKAYHLILLLVCAGVLAASFILRPNEGSLSLFGWRWPFTCWLHETFGVRCALCGMSRSFCSLAHGDIGASLAFHRLGPFLFAVFCLEIPYRLYALAIQPKTVNRRLVKVHVGIIVLVCAAILCGWFVYLEGLIV
jgi:hypothetical protein